MSDGPIQGDLAFQGETPDEVLAAQVEAIADILAQIYRHTTPSEDRALRDAAKRLRELGEQKRATRAAQPTEGTDA